MATYNPHVISVFLIGLILDSIKNSSQLRPWGENKQKHDHLFGGSSSTFVSIFQHLFNHLKQLNKRS